MTKKQHCFIKQEALNEYEKFFNFSDDLRVEIENESSDDGWEVISDIEDQTEHFRLNLEKKKSTSYFKEKRLNALFNFNGINEL